MNLLHIIIGLNVGGAELMLKRLIESHQGNANYRHSVISLTSIGKVGLQLEAIGVQVITLEMRSALDVPRVFWRLMRQIHTAAPDIVQTWMYHADLLGGVAAYCVGNRNIIWGVRTTALTVGRSRATSVIRWVCARLSRRIPYAIVCAAEASRQAHVAAGYDGSRMQVINNGFDIAHLVATVDQRDALRSECGIGTDELVIGSVARFNPVKDQRTFIRAAGFLASKNSHVRFLMVGSGLDAGNAELAEWIEQTGFAERFILLGERSDIPVCLSAMDIFCLHSLTEGFPNALGEAMAMGLPCVSTDVGDAAMLIADTGIVAPKGDAIALAEGLSQLVRITSGERAALGRRAKARIHAEFSMVRTRERFEAIYQQVSNKG